MEFKIVKNALAGRSAKVVFEVVTRQLFYTQTKAIWRFNVLFTTRC